MELTLIVLPTTTAHDECRCRTTDVRSDRRHMSAHNLQRRGGGRAVDTQHDHRELGPRSGALWGQLDEALMRSTGKWNEPARSTNEHRPTLIGVDLTELGSWDPRLKRPACTHQRPRTPASSPEATPILAYFRPLRGRAPSPTPTSVAAPEPRPRLESAVIWPPWAHHNP